MAKQPEKVEPEPDASVRSERAPDLVAKSPLPGTEKSPVTRAEMKAFAAERNAMLLACDVDRMLAFNTAHHPNPPRFVSREVAEVTLHMARTEAKSLPLEARLSSKDWLHLRGYPSCDDGDL